MLGFLIFKNYFCTRRIRFPPTSTTMTRTTKFANRITGIACLFGFILYYNNVSGQTSVLTQHNDLKRTGWDSTETQLTQSNVSSGRFGKLFSRPVDDQIYAQPLIVSNLSISGGTHNVVFVATVNNSVYAFDADDSATSAPYWQVNLTYNPSGYRAPTNSDLSAAGACGGNYLDFTGKMGIVGTPVIDTSTNTLYVVARSISNDGSTYVQYLHALDITTGAEKSGSPVYITATYPGTGSGSVGGIITFNQKTQNQRPALLLYNGVVYICWSSHCDLGPYQGWVIGYDSKTLAQKYVYNDCANGGLAGIWMGGQAPSVDDSGYIYLTTGNGTVGSGTNPNDTTNRGESLLKLSTTTGKLKVKDFFTPNNYSFLNTTDLDYGTDGALLMPNTALSLSGSKEGILYLINDTAMGGYRADNSNALQALSVNNSGTSYYRNLHGTPVYFKDNNNNEYIYAWASSTSNSPGFLKQYPFVRDSMRFDTLNTIVGNTQLPAGKPGGMLSLSSNGSQAGTGILWASHPINGNANQATVPGELQAFDATDVTHELWNSNWSAKRDSIGSFAKFVCPTIANGKVYMATFSNALNVYGLNPPAASPCSNTLPSGWTSDDIGYTAYAGDICYDSAARKYTITASGSDINNNVDAFHYCLRPTLGINYLDVTMRVDKIQNTNSQAKCGIMFRQNLDPGSPNVFLSLLPASGGITVQSRTSQNGSTTSTAFSGYSVVYWLRMVNSGNMFISYASPDGITWTPLDTVMLALGNYPYVGLAYTTHNNYILGTAIVDSFSVKLVDGGTLGSDLLQFTAKNVQEKTAHLSWTWANQNGAVDHFDIERSSATTDFEKIGMVSANPAPEGMQNYTFDDLQPLDNENYYRLKVVYADGSYKYSLTKKVSFNFDVMLVYPNPAKNKIFIQNNGHFTGNGQLRVTLADIEGNIIFRQTIATGDINPVSIPLPSRISQGMYVLWLINAKGQKQGQKIYIIH